MFISGVISMKLSGYSCPSKDVPTFEKYTKYTIFDRLPNLTMGPS
jgi:hypothetical protein